MADWQGDPIIKTRKPTTPDCPCGSGLGYSACCEMLHAGGNTSSPESLMRSRYSAYVLGKEDHLLKTWHPDTRPASIDCSGPTQWNGLQIRRTTDSSSVAEGDTALVEFVARYRINGKAGRLHEISRFLLKDGCWYYLNGSFPDKSA
jgi:SEC-C motif domain protein